jgi:hypothetical protein
VVSPAPKYNDYIGPHGQGSWENEFVDRAIKDSTGSPVEGTFGICFSFPHDLCSLNWQGKQADLRIATRIMCYSREDPSIGQKSFRPWSPTGPPISLNTAMDSARQLLSAKEHMKKGSIVAFRYGMNIFCIVEITSDYTFCPEEAWGWHRWSYRVLRKVSRAEQPANYRGMIKTFLANYYLPQAVAAPIATPQPVAESEPVAAEPVSESVAAEPVAAEPVAAEPVAAVAPVAVEEGLDTGPMIVFLVFLVIVIVDKISREA